MRSNFETGTPLIMMMAKRVDMLESLLGLQDSHNTRQAQSLMHRTPYRILQGGDLSNELCKGAEDLQANILFSLLKS